MATAPKPPGKPRGFQKGGAAYAGPPKGAGWGGKANGKKERPDFTAATQPSGDLKSAGIITKAEMIARLSGKRMALADKLIALAERAESEQVQLTASIAILDRLDGKPTQGTPGDGGEQVTRVEYSWAGNEE